MDRSARNAMAARAAADIPEGWWVNLGIGIPTLVADHVPLAREVVFHSENGVLGMGPAPPPGAVNRWLINAGKQPVTLRPGGSFMSQSDSFGLIRGGHLDLSVMGGFEVAANGDLANWSRGDADYAPAVGGAMDLAAGAKRLWVVMGHQTKDGRPRIVTRCTMPLTALGAVSRIYTDLATLDVHPAGLVVKFITPGLDLADLQARTGSPLVDGRSENPPIG